MLKKSTGLSTGLLTAGLPTLIAGTSISFLLGQNLPKSMLAGLATAASGVGIVALYGGNQTTRIKLLESEISNRADAKQFIDKAEQLRNEANHLQTSVQQLKGQENQVQEQVRSAEQQLNQAKGQFNELTGQGQVLKQQINQLTGQKTELERKLNELEQNNPDWKTRDQLQTQIEELRQSSNSLSGQVAGLLSEVDRLEGVRRSLLTTEATLATKQAEFNAVTTQVEALQTESSQLAAQSAQLELLRNTYDGLLQERGSLEARITHLEPEKTRLESELQPILQAIQENETKYAQAEQIRREIQDLEQQRRQLWSEVRGLQADKERLEQDQAALEARIKQLEARIKELQAIVQKYEAKQADSDHLVEIALEALKTDLWSADTLVNSPREPVDESVFVQGLIQYVKDRGFKFSPRVIRAFHTSLKVQGISALVVLAGISGTGKSELPGLYAEYIGAQFLMLAVQPRWDSPQDLLGFYNYIENKFKPTPLIQGLYQYQNSLARQDRIVLVLLDEMNLARVEYYFSEFLSKLERRRNHASETHLDIDLGNLPVEKKDRKFGIPEQFLFVGTMNEDETTQSLSDKVLDRANVLTFGKPDRLGLGKNGKKSAQSVPYLTYSQFMSWSTQPDARSPIVEKLDGILSRANSVMEKMGHPFAHRVYQAIAWYVVNYPGVIQGNTIAFQEALADQFAQKLLPKLRGVMVVDHRDHLRELGAIIEEIGDSILKAAFVKAEVGHYGQFQWKGLVYPEDQEVG